MPTTDPLMAVADRVPLVRADEPEPPDRDLHLRLIRVFGLRFAVDPITPSDKHKKTYYTVTVKEATLINKDGTVVTVTDDVEKERED